MYLVIDLIKYKYLLLLLLLVEQTGEGDQGGPRDKLDFHKYYQVKRFDL
jgi:hypothetical protein